MKKIAFPLLSLVALIAGPGYASEAAFVSADQSHVLQILPQPPAPTSDVTKQELMELHRIETSRTTEQAAQAFADEQDESMFLYRNVLGATLSPDALPITAAFSARVKNDEGVNTDPAKKAFHRMRPYNLDKTLHPVCATKAKDNSYPSGHTTAGYMEALALIDMVPEKRDAILARADDYAHNRLVCGVHYPSDLQAGKVLAYAIHAIMTTNPQYQKELAAAKLELRHALGLPVVGN